MSRAPNDDQPTPAPVAAPEPLMAQREFAGKAAMDAALAEWRAKLPPVPSAYQPSGEASAGSLLLLTVAAAGVSVGAIIVIVLVEVAYVLLGTVISHGTILGLGGLLLDVILMIGAGVGPGMVLCAIAKKLKVRTAAFVAIVSCGAALLASGLTFPFSPTFELTYREFDIYWVLMPLGIITAVLGAGKAALDSIRSQ